MTRAKTHPLTDWDGNHIVIKYLNELHGPKNEAQKAAETALRDGDYSLCKVLAACHLSDHYCRTIGYLSSVESTHAGGMPQLCTLLTEAARAAADSWYDFVLGEGRGEKSAEITRSQQLAVFSEVNARIFAKALKRVGNND